MQIRDTLAKVAFVGLLTTAVVYLICKGAVKTAWEKL